MLRKFLEVLLDTAYRGGCLEATYNNFADIDKNQLCLYNILKSAVILDLCLHIIYLIDKARADVDKKVCSLPQLYQDYQKELGTENCQKIEFFLNNRKTFSKNMLNKRRKLLAHIDLRLHVD